MNTSSQFVATALVATVWAHAHYGGQFTTERPTSRNRLR